MDYRLVFADEAEADSVLFTMQEGIDDDPVMVPNYTYIDVIGPIEPSVGWHVNVRNNTEAPELDQYLVVPEPTNPVRVWL